MTMLLKVRRMYYGWWIVLAAGIIMGWTGGLGYLTFGLLFIPFSDSFGWDRAEISLAFTFFNVQFLIVSPIAGWVIDKYGPKKAVIYGVLSLSLGYILLSRIDSLLEFYLIFPLVIGLGVHFSDVAPNTSAVAKWFVRKRGRALGIQTGISSVVCVIVPVVTAPLIVIYGWQNALVILGISALVICLPFSMLHRSDMPEKYGLKPDGDSSLGNSQGENDASSNDRAPIKDFTIGGAIKTSAFWIIGFSWIMVAGSYAVMYLNLPNLLTDDGISLQFASLGWVAFYCGAVPGRFFGTPLADKFEVRYLLIISCILQAIGLIFIPQAETIVSNYIGLFFIGLVMGPQFSFYTTMIAQYYGRKYFATIRGWMSVFMMVGMSVAPYHAGLMYEQYGGFLEAFIIYSILSIAAAALIYYARQPSSKIDV